MIESDKNCRAKSHVFTSLTIEMAINHECVMVTTSLQLSYKILPGITNNYAYSGRLLKCSSSSSSPKGSQFSISLASIPNDENMRFRPAIFIRLVLAPFCSKWHKKPVIQQLRPCSLWPFKNYVHTPSNYRTMTCQSWITFFLIHPVYL